VLNQLYESAANLQEVVPDATLVGGSAAAFYAGHRDSFDHGHVSADVADHFDMVLCPTGIWRGSNQPWSAATFRTGAGSALRFAAIHGVRPLRSSPRSSPVRARTGRRA